MKTKPLIPITILLFLSCQYISELKHKDEIVSEAYVQNPNGLALYKIKGDLKSKEITLSQGEKFFFLEDRQEEEKDEMRRVLFAGKTLHTYNTYNANALEYQNIKPDELHFGVLQEEGNLRDKPFTLANVVEKIPRYSVIEILNSEKQFRYQRFLKVKTQNGKVGFVDADVSRFKTEDIARKNSLAETILGEGYLLVTSKEPVFLSSESMLPLDKAKYDEILKKGNLLFVNYSKVFDGVRYYSFRSIHPMEYLQGDSSVLIAESNGKLLNQTEFTEYTIQSTNFKEDKRIIKQIKKIGGYWQNFTNFHLTKLLTDLKGGKYYLATVTKGMSGVNSSYLLREFNRGYSPIEWKSDDFVIEEVKTFDLDNDGVLEILSRGQERGDVYYELFGRKNGKYRVIASFSTDTKFVKDVIHVKDYFSENLSYNEEDGSYDTKSHPKGTKLKYQKGKLIKIK